MFPRGLLPRRSARGAPRGARYRRGTGLEAGRKRDALRLWSERFRARFSGRILPFDEAAAVALRHGAILTTRNTSDFEPTGVKLIDPWKV